MASEEVICEIEEEAGGDRDGDDKILIPRFPAPERVTSLKRRSVGGCAVGACFLLISTFSHTQPSPIILLVPHLPISLVWIEQPLPVAFYVVTRHPCDIRTAPRPLYKRTLAFRLLRYYLASMAAFRLTVHKPRMAHPSNLAVLMTRPFLVDVAPFRPTLKARTKACQCLLVPPP